MDITFNVNLTLLRISFVAYFTKDYFGKWRLMAIGVITMRKYLQVLFASEQQKYHLSAANRISLRIPKMTETPLTMEAETDWKF